MQSPDQFQRIDSPFVPRPPAASVNQHAPCKTSCESVSLLYPVMFVGIISKIEMGNCASAVFVVCTGRAANMHEAGTAEHNRLHAHSPTETPTADTGKASNGLRPVHAMSIEHVPLRR